MEIAGAAGARAVGVGRAVRATVGRTAPRADRRLRSRRRRLRAARDEHRDRQGESGGRKGHRNPGRYHRCRRVFQRIHRSAARVRTSAPRGATRIVCSNCADGGAKNPSAAFAPKHDRLAIALRTRNRAVVRNARARDDSAAFGRDCAAHGTIGVRDVGVRQLAVLAHPAVRRAARKRSGWNGPARAGAAIALVAVPTAAPQIRTAGLAHRPTRRRMRPEHVGDRSIRSAARAAVTVRRTRALRTSQRTVVGACALVAAVACGAGCTRRTRSAARKCARTLRDTSRGDHGRARPQATHDHRQAQ